MTTARITVPGATLAVTRRTMFRKLLWTPNDPVVRDGFLYPLALGQQRHDVEVHHASVLPTHHHTTITPTKANAPQIYRLLHRESGRLLQEYLLECGYDAPPNVWDGRPTHDMQLVDAGAQIEWLLYEHVQAVAAGLVERVEDFPGVTTDLGLMKGGVIVVKRPPVYFSKDKPEELLLRFTPPPILKQAFGGDVGRLVHHLRREARRLEDQYRRERSREGLTVLGAAKVKKIHPWSEPRTRRERRGQPIPRYKVDGSHEEPDTRTLRARCKSEVRGFWSDHAEAMERWKAGDRAAPFPYGSYEMPRLHAAMVAEPLEGAILCRPGIASAIQVAETTKLGEQARAAVLDAAVADVDDLRDLTEAPAESAAGAAAGDDTPSAVELESPARSAERPHPKRTVTLRDRHRRHAAP